MGMPSMPELIVILVIILLLFGAKKIPDLAKGLGSGIKNFKKALNEEDEPQKITDSNPQQNEQTNTTVNNSAQPTQNIPQNS
jgi:sec-independent protein translocase protein TatA